MIQMIAGVYGRKMPDGSVKAMDKNSAPFEVSPETEERLIRLGLAVRADHVDTEMPIGFDETPPEDDGEDARPLLVYSMENTAAELREIGKQFGLTFKVGMTKADMVAALDAYFDPNVSDGVDIDEDAAEDDGEDAPSFDASEAVL